MIQDAALTWHLLQEARSSSRMSDAGTELSRGGSLFEHSFRWTDRTLEIRMDLRGRYAIQRFGIAPKD